MKDLTIQDLKNAIKELEKNSIKPINGYYYSWQFGMTDKEWILCWNLLTDFGNQMDDLKRRRN